MRCPSGNPDHYTLPNMLITWYRHKHCVLDLQNCAAGYSTNNVTNAGTRYELYTPIEAAPTGISTVLPVALIVQVASWIQKFESVLYEFGFTCTYVHVLINLVVSKFSKEPVSKQRQKTGIRRGFLGRQFSKF